MSFAQASPCVGCRGCGLSGLGVDAQDVGIDNSPSQPSSGGGSWFNDVLKWGGSISNIFGGARGQSWTPATCPASAINARVGSDGWWYDLSDGHRLSHEEASAKCNSISQQMYQPQTAGVSMNTALLFGAVIVGGALLLSRRK